MNQEEKKLQEKYMEMKLLEEQMKEVQKKAETVQQQILELSATAQSLDDFNKVEEGTEILVPISSGIFTKASIKENKEFLVNIGADTVVTKNSPDTKKLIEDQITEMQALHAKINIQMQKLAIHSASLENEFKELVSKIS